MTDGQRKRPRIADVARAAGVSTTTVSDSLNGKGRLDSATRAHVIAAARRLGYHANANARNLRHSQGSVLGFVASMPTDPAFELTDVEYVVKLLTAAATTSLAYGHALVLTPIVADENAVAPGAINVDGVLLMDPVEGSPLLRGFEDANTLTVTTGRALNRPSVATWWVDNDVERATEAMLDIFAARGSKSIALLCNQPDRSYTRDTIAAYERWARGKRMTQCVMLVGGRATVDEAYDAVARLLATKKCPDAIFALFDRLAIGALLAVRAAGLRVPENVLIAAGSDSAMLRAAAPPITAIDLHPERVGRYAAEMLIRRLEDRAAPPVQMVVDVDIIERASTVRQP